MKLREDIFTKGRLVETDSNKLPKGVLCKVVYPICNIDEKNQNHRVYSKALWEKVLAEENFVRKQQERTLFGQAEHPEETQSDLQLTSHIITKTWIDEASNKVYQEMDVLNTPCGKIINTLLEAGCLVGVSTRAEGELEEVTEGNETHYNVLPESYSYVTTDFTADPSTFNVKPIKYESNVVTEIKAGLKSKKLDKHFATVLLESMNSKEAKTVLKEMKDISIAVGKDNAVQEASEGLNEASKASKADVLRIAGELLKGGTQARVSDVVKAVSRETGEDYFKVRNYVKHVLSQAGWDTSKMESNELVGKLVRIKEGEHKGKFAKIKSINEEDVTVTLSNGAEIVTNTNRIDMDAVQINTTKVGGGDTVEPLEIEAEIEPVEPLDDMGDGEMEGPEAEDEYDMDGELNVGAPKKEEEEKEEYAFESKEKGCKECGNLAVGENGLCQKCQEEEERRKERYKSESKTNEVLEYTINYTNPTGESKIFDQTVSAANTIEAADKAQILIGEDNKITSLNVKASEKKGPPHNVKEYAAQKKYGKSYADLDKKERQWVDASIVNEGSFGYDGRYKILYDILNSRLGHMVAIQIENIEQRNPDEANSNALKRIADELVRIPDSIEGQQEILGDITAYLNDEYNYDEDEGYEEDHWAAGDSYAESKSITNTVRNLRISEAGIKAEREKAIELLEQAEQLLKSTNSTKALEFKMLSTKLKEAQSKDSLEIKALCKKLEEKTASINKVKKQVEELKASYSNDLLKIKEQVEKHRKDVLKVTEDHKIKLAKEETLLEEKYRRKFIKKYVDMKLESTGWNPHKSTRALLEKKGTIKEVDESFDELLDVMRQNALHSKSLNEFVIRKNEKTDPEMKRIEKNIEGLNF